MIHVAEIDLLHARDSSGPRRLQLRLSEIESKGTIVSVVQRTPNKIWVVWRDKA